MLKNNADTKIRLNKLIAESGLASRRAADKLIEEGHVTVNGKRVYELGVRVDPQVDKVVVDGKPLKKPTPKIYVMFNKPKGVLTTMEDPLERPCVSHYLEKVPYRVFPVGRLDYDSEGLLLLTNDGEFANKVMHPKLEVTKTYLVKIDGQPEQHKLDKLLKGVTIEGGKVAAKHLEKIRPPGEKKSEKYEWYKIVITEGKNRQIRQMFAKIGFDVLKLQRVAVGRLRLGQLASGDLLFLNEVAVERVFLADDPNEIKAKRGHKGKSTDETPKAAPKKRKAPTRKTSSKRAPSKSKRNQKFA
ncbi:MAG: pseudouridine synthase [Bdellovibrionia bacterium]